MPTPGVNLDYSNPSFISQLLVRYLGLHPKSIILSQPVSRLNGIVDHGTTFPRLIGLCVKFDPVTPPTSFASGDNPTGVGDICVWVKSENVGGVKIPVLNLGVFRCGAYGNTMSFTWLPF